MSSFPKIKHIYKNVPKLVLSSSFFHKSFPKPSIDNSLYIPIQGAHKKSYILFKNFLINGKECRDKCINLFTWSFLY